jgi:glycerophosphoryl diester phosphodiesterase
MYPENSPSAILAAAEAGADIVELDVRLTGDNIPICVHDNSLERLTGVGIPVEKLTADEILKTTRIDGGTFLTLEKALRLVERKIDVLLDLKQVEVSLINIVTDIIENTAFEDVSVVFGIRSPILLPAIRNRARSYNTLAFLTDPDDLDTFIRGQGNIIRLWERDVERRRITQLQAAGLDIWVMVGGKDTNRQVGDIDRSRLESLFDLNIDGILVNDPELCLEIRQMEMIFKW